MLNKSNLDKKHRAQPEETLEAYMKKTLPGAGFLKKWNATMYKKFCEVFGDYYKDTSLKVCMVPAFNCMDLADSLIFKISERLDPEPMR